MWLLFTRFRLHSKANLGAFVFLNQPLHYFLDEYISLNDVFGRDVDETWEQLQEAVTIKEKFLLAENFYFYYVIYV